MMSNEPSAIEQFDAAVKRITDDRGAVYGHPADDFAKAQRIKDAVKDCPDTLIRHCLEMIGIKMARLTTTPDHIDSLIDIHGYARCAVMIIERQRESTRKSESSI